MRPDAFTNTPEDAAAYERIRGRDEEIGGEVGDQGAGFDETKLCDRCEHGHGGHVCANCAGAVR